jgi:hypothetical protein
MKKYIFIFLLFSFAITACDYVSNPYESSDPLGAGNSLVDTIPLDTTLVDNVHERVVLLEDYTGHKCTACPQAATQASLLKQTYGEQLVVIGVHAGFFATPTTPAGAPAGSYLVDFRTTAGEEYDSPTYFGISNAGNPNGMINRKDYTPTTYDHIKPYSSWNTEISALLAITPLADLTVGITYDSASRQMTIKTITEFVSSSLTSANYKLIVMITQDSIIDWQLDGTTHVSNYVHRHVLRDNVNSTWGSSLINGSFPAYSHITRSFTYSLPTAYNGNTCDADHCYVAAFIYDATTYEVIQAAEAKVIP